MCVCVCVCVCACRLLLTCGFTRVRCESRQSATLTNSGSRCIDI